MIERSLHGALYLVVLFSTALSALAEVTDSQKPFSMLCVTEKGTGFNWRNDDWVETSFKPDTYVLTKLAKDDGKCWMLRGDELSRPIVPIGGGQYGGESKGCYELKEVGEKAGEVSLARERWDQQDGGFVLKDVIADSFSDYRAEVDGPFVLTRTYGIFFSGDQRDSMLLQIGKCSLLATP